MDDELKPIVGISCGDLNGIGMEIIMKALADPELMSMMTPVVFASAKVVSYHRKALQMEEFNFHIINDWEQLNHRKPNLFNCWKEEVFLEFGKVDKKVGSYALRSFEAACDALDQGKVEALVTAPINKNSIHGDDFRFTGHTDYLEDRYKGESLMMLVSDQMKMALATVHIPLREVVDTLSTEKIIHKLRIINQSLINDFHKRKGKIAMLSINPHAGDGGVIGNEDDEIVVPAVKQAFDEGIMTFGPYSADSFFGSGKFQEFDAVLAMYHDQGLIPFKTLSFGQGVNFTAGLDIIRTSPDHGTGFDIAGQGLANESSFREALYLACDLARNRGISKEISKDPLKVKKGKKDY